MSRFWKTNKDFFSRAEQMREEFESRFAHPLETSSERFVWDYWHVPNQYSLMRTSAEHFFSAEIFEKFITELTDYGQQNLGCHELTTPWLSYYIEGCEQQMHTDSPHGPWAYVFSLTPWQERVFTGGETFMLSPETLSYWQNFDPARGQEREELLKEIPPEFNQLTVFDPRLPHGVNPIRGTKDPLKARLVIHGWFTSPGPYLEGPVDEDNVHDVFENNLNPLFDEIDGMGSYSGVLSFTIHIEKTGQVSEVETLTETLLAIDNKSEPVEVLKEKVKSKLGQLVFSGASSSSRITLPFVFT